MTATPSGSPSRLSSSSSLRCPRNKSLLLRLILNDIYFRWKLSLNFSSLCLISIFAISGQCEKSWSKWKVSCWPHHSSIQVNLELSWKVIDTWNLLHSGISGRWRHSSYHQLKERATGLARKMKTSKNEGCMFFSGLFTTATNGRWTFARLRTLTQTQLFSSASPHRALRAFLWVYCSTNSMRTFEEEETDHIRNSLHMCQNIFHQPNFTLWKRNAGVKPSHVEVPNFHPISTHRLQSEF